MKETYFSGVPSLDSDEKNDLWKDLSNYAVNTWGRWADAFFFVLSEAKSKLEEKGIYCSTIEQLYDSIRSSHFHWCD